MLGKKESARAEEEAGGQWRGALSRTHTYMKLSEKNNHKKEAKPACAVLNKPSRRFPLAFFSKEWATLELQKSLS